MSVWYDGAVLIQY